MRAISREIFEASKRFIPGGVNSPVRSFPHLPLTPLVLEKGEGDTVWDVDGHPYIDYCCSWGALILGHADPEVVASVQRQAALGSSFGTATKLEYLMARDVAQAIPCIDKIRFVSSGTEATMTAARLARGYTGKRRIVKFDGNYHGHADGFLIRAGSGVTHLQDASSQGVPLSTIDATVSLPYNATEIVEKFLLESEDIAAVILEPICGNMGCVPAKPSFIQMLREVTKKKGILLIFDEVITGFRVGFQGAEAIYKMTPDLICLGKIIGGGYPVAALGGKADIMDCLAPLGQVYQAGTLSGNSVAMAAGLATLKQLTPDVYIELQRKADLLLTPIRSTIEDLNLEACVQSIGSMFTIFFGARSVTHKIPLNEALYRKFFVYLFENGVYFPPCQYEAAFISIAHTDEHLQKTAGLMISFLKQL